MATATNQKIEAGALFEQDLAHELEDPAFRAAFELQCSKNLAMAKVMAAVDAERQAQSLTKAEMGRRIGRKRPSISRLLSGTDQNSTFGTIADALYSVGLQAEIKITRAPKRSKKAEPVKVKVAL